jgi:hypothetical protein
MKIYCGGAAHSMGDGGQLRDEAGGSSMLLDGHGVVIGVEKASSTSREGRSVMLRRQGDGRCGAAEANNGGGDELHAMWRSTAQGKGCWWRDAASSCGAMPLVEDCGVMLPQRDDGVMPS